MNDTVKLALGSFVPYASLTTEDRTLVDSSWRATEFAYTPLSDFPVGAMVQVANERGHTRNFFGCNVENRFMSCTICAERNAITTAVASGFRNLKKIALVLQKYQGPGASPCGLCRQVMMEFGPDAIVLQAADKERNVGQFLVRELLPAASSASISFDDAEASMRRQIKKLLQLSQRSYVPYSKKPGAAFFTATNARGITKIFAGVSDDNSSYGGSAAAEVVAMRTAKTAGYISNPSLMLLTVNPSAPNPIEGESLQVLREFGTRADVLLVGADGSHASSNVCELLPDSFGPESLV